MKSKKKTETRVRTFRISPVLDEQLKAVAESAGVTVSTLLAEAVVNFLRDYRRRIIKEFRTVEDERIKNLLQCSSISDPLKRKRRNA